jgi:hypothetical protein
MGEKSARDRISAPGPGNSIEATILSIPVTGMYGVHPV